MYRNQPGLYVLYMVSALARKREEQRERGVGSGSIVSRTVTLFPERFQCFQNRYNISGMSIVNRSEQCYPKPQHIFPTLPLAWLCASIAYGSKARP